MKNGYPKKLPGLLLCLLLTLFLTGWAGAESAAFAPGEPHEHTLDFRLWFETLSAQTDACTLSIQAKVYDEAQAEELLGVVSGDLEAVRALTGAELQPHTVYVAEKLFDGVQRFENRVYCRAEDILSGAYREYLIAAALGLPDRWKAVGLEECLKGEQTEAGMGIRLYFGWAADMDLLSLFPAYFESEFSGMYERGLARQTAGLLCRYILDNHGYAALAGTVGDELRSGWLQSIGVDRAYHDPYGGLLEGLVWETSQKYPLILTTAKGDIFYLKALPDDMETAADVRAFMDEAISGPQKVIDGLRADAPEYADFMQENFARPLKYYMEPESDRYSYANWASQEIHLGHTGTVIHETMHILTRVYATYDRYYMDQWKVEGLAEYLSLRYGSSMTAKESIFWEMTELDLTPSEDDTEQQLLLKEVIRIGYEFYRAEAGGMPECAEDVDEFLYNLSMAKGIQLTQSEEWSSVGDAFNDLNGLNITQRFVNGLTYEESFSFAEYIIRTHSLEKFLDFCSTETFFEDFYGLTYEEALQGWYEDMFGVNPAADAR